MAVGYDGSIRIDTRIDTKGFQSGVKTMTASLTRFAGVLFAVFSVDRIIKFGATAVQTASDMASALIGLQSVVEGTGGSFKAAQDFIDSYVADGLIPAQDAITAYKNLLLRGYDTGQIETTLNALKDSAAFGRSAHLTMGEAVKTASEGLKNENSILVDNAGVTKNVSMMWKEYAASIGTTVSALTQQQKIQAEVNGILHETRFQVGDAAKLSNTYAGRVSALGVSFTNLKVAIGNTIIPVLNQIIPYLKAAIDALTIFFNRLAQIMNILFGTNVGMASAEAAKNLGATAEASNAAAEGQGNLAKNTKEAAKAAKGALASFDDLNVLQRETPTGAGAGAGAGAGMGAGGLDVGGIDDATATISDLAEKVGEWRDNFVEFVRPVSEAFGRLFLSMQPLTMLIWDGLVWIWENVLKPLGSWVISEYLPAFIDLLAAAIDFLVPVLEALAPVWQWFWENVLLPIANWTGDAILWVIEKMTELFQNLAAWVSENKETFVALIAVVGIAAAVLSFLFIPIGGVILIIGALIAAVLLLGKHWDWVTEKAQMAADGFKNAWNGFSEWFKNTIANPFISIVNRMVNVVVTILNGLIGALNSIQINIPSWVPNLGGASFGLNIPAVNPVRIPRLARGAVIPPNSEFMAVLGDQTSGRNLEAPESMFRQLLQEELGRIEADIRLDFGGSMGELIRLLKPYIEKEDVRIGGSLLTGGSV